MAPALVIRPQRGHVHRLDDARRAARRAQAAPPDGRHSVSVVCRSPHIRRIFEITLLDRVFALHETRDAARRAAGDAISGTPTPDGAARSARHRRVEFPAGDGYRERRPSLVLGGLVSRFELPVDRVEDLLLAVESLLVQGVVGETVAARGHGDRGRAARAASDRSPGPARRPRLSRVSSPGSSTRSEEVPTDDGAGAV